MTLDPQETAKDDEGQEFEDLPNEVLHELVLRDPFDMRRRAADYVRDRALLLDLNRFFLRTTARMGRDLDALSGDSVTEVWIADCLKLAERQLLNEDAALAGKPDEGGTLDPAHARLAEALRIAPSQASAAAVAFNNLAEDLRRVAYATLVEQRTFSELAEATGRTVSQVRSQATLALTSLVFASYSSPNRNGAPSHDSDLASSQSRD